MAALDIQGVTENCNFKGRHLKGNTGEQEDAGDYETPSRGGGRRGRTSQEFRIRSSFILIIIYSFIYSVKRSIIHSKKLCKILRFEPNFGENRRIR